MLTKRFFPGINEAIERLRKEGMIGAVTEESLSARKTILKDPEQLGRWLIFGPGVGYLIIEVAMRKSKVRWLKRSTIAVHVPAGRSCLLYPDLTLSYRIIYAR